MSSSRKSQEGKGGKKASPVYPAYKRMAGKVALVTGAGSGIGRGIAMKFASEGAKLALLDINQAGMDETIALIKKDINKDVEALAIKTDVTSEAAVVSAVSTTTSKLGGLDVMMCNAGIQHIDSVRDLTYDNWRKVISVHLDAAFLLTRECMRYMSGAGKGGSLLYMGSVHSKVASVLKAPYVSAKHGVMGLCRLMAKEGAEFGITSNLICPGFVKTPLVSKQIPEQAKNLGMSEEDVIKKVMLKDTVDGEFTTIEDVAEVATFLATFPSAALTGQSLVVSHGWVME